MSGSATRKRLITLLQRAHAGERAAALAYRGHWRSLSQPDERAEVRRVEMDEWRHRELLGEQLSSLGSGCSSPRETLALFVGSTLGALCHVSGWLLPMYGAALLETQNVREYEEAARLARLCGRADLAPALREMARVELEHEAFFHGRVARHPVGRHFPGLVAPSTAPGMGEWARDERDGTTAPAPGGERRHPRGADPARV